MQPVYTEFCQGAHPIKRLLSFKHLLKPFPKGRVARVIVVIGWESLLMGLEILHFPFEVM
jgi:hypothetical protein